MSTAKFIQIYTSIIGKQLIRVDYFVSISLFLIL